MSTLPFAAFTPKPSAWGYNWTIENISQPKSNFRASPTDNANGSVSTSSPSSPEPNQQMIINQYMHLPAALLSSLKREKKPFTYTPGGVNLSEVLNARLQKRLERKKKRAPSQITPEKFQNPSESLPKFDPQKQVIVMPTYNTPLDMYSVENALEALEVQAELAVSDNNLSAPSRSATLPRNHTFRFDDKDYDSNKNVVQSKAFKVLQIITDTEEEPKFGSSSKSPHHEEQRFTGIRESKEIPSKFFHNLQKITGTEENTNEVYKPKEMAQQGAPRTNVFNKQPTRPGFLPQTQKQPVKRQQQQSNLQKPNVGKFQPMNRPAIVNLPPPINDMPHLKRPAAFLSSKLPNPMGHVKPVHPSFLANGPRQVFNPSEGTDF